MNHKSAVFTKEFRTGIFARLNSQFSVIHNLDKENYFDSPFDFKGELDSEN
jgi:hypothetical protein